MEILTLDSKAAKETYKEIYAAYKQLANLELTKENQTIAYNLISRIVGLRSMLRDSTGGWQCFKMVQKLEGDILEIVFSK
ncbi:hypothetical protein [Fundidesulfovibrio putealis]|uniref:hypothetical protein n=1 Tax=Fundidesulfovibrio putealis TaxID=270496 RepID=UPI0012EC4FC3|nr:hypothetical protein [Fundidesulfovibrio putealis]